MELDLSVLTSGIALVTAILSPVITTTINNHHQDKIFKEEFYDKHRAEVIENYISAAGSIINFDDRNAIRTFWKASQEIYLYIPEELWGVVDETNDFIKEHNFKSANICLQQLVKALAKNPPRSIK